MTVNITGQLHQRWLSEQSDGVYDTPTANSTNATNGDSHFLATNSDVIRERPEGRQSSVHWRQPTFADEDDNNGYGVGTSMSAAFGPPGAPVTSMNIAYIVSPKTSIPNLNISVKVFDSNGDKIATLNLGGPSPPSLLVSGNGLFISNGENTPSLAKGTDFGTVPRGSTQTRTFNAIDEDPFFSPLPLPLAPGPPMFTGPFSLVGAFPSPSFYGGPFTIGLDTSVPGSYTGSISFPTNDPFNDPFTFALAARVVPEPSSVLLATFALFGVAGIARCRG